MDEGDKDEKFCLLLASLIKDFQWLEVDLELLWSLLPTSVLRANGETTYHLTLVSSAININKTGKNPITDTTSSTSKTVVRFNIWCPKYIHIGFPKSLVMHIILLETKKE